MPIEPLGTTELPQWVVNERLALAWLMNPQAAPLETFSEDVQRLVAALSSKLRTPNLDDKTHGLIEAHKREAAEVEKAKEIASYNRAQKRAAQIEDEEFSALLSDEKGTASLAARFASDALSADSLDSIPDHEPLIADFINRDTLCRIFGPPKSLKSFIALSMAAAIGTGERWFGYRTTKTPVLYVVAEGARGIRPRVRAWEQMNGRKMTGVTFYPKAVQIGDDDQMRQLIAFARMGGYGLVIFDTQARCTVGHEENSNTDMGRIIARLDKLREWTQAGVMLVHHSGNEGGRARGATAILAAVDSEFEVKRDKGTTKVTVITRAQKDIKEASDLEIEGVKIDLVLEDGKIDDSLAFRVQGAFTVESVTVTITDKQAEVLRIVAQYNGVGIAQTAIAKEMGLEASQRGTVGKHLSGLLGKGCVEKLTASSYQATSAGLRQLDTYDQQRARQDVEEYAQDELSDDS
ncbi:AAA family ATPase [Streptomyces sp. ISL-24]|nr:AAA family ATPase [Streptomyces sp. ISL-24]